MSKHQPVSETSHPSALSPPVDPFLSEIYSVGREIASLFAFTQFTSCDDDVFGLMPRHEDIITHHTTDSTTLHNDGVCILGDAALKRRQLSNGAVRVARVRIPAFPTLLRLGGFVPYFHRVNRSAQPQYFQYAPVASCAPAPDQTHSQHSKDGGGGPIVYARSASHPPPPSFPVVQIAVSDGKNARPIDISLDNMPNFNCTCLDELDIVQEIGSGTYGLVYVVRYKDNRVCKKGLRRRKASLGDELSSCVDGSDSTSQSHSRSKSNTEAPIFALKMLRLDVSGNTSQGIPVHVLREISVFQQLLCSLPVSRPTNRHTDDTSDSTAVDQSMQTPSLSAQFETPPTHSFSRPQSYKKALKDTISSSRKRAREPMSAPSSHQNKGHRNLLKLLDFVVQGRAARDGDAETLRRFHFVPSSCGSASFIGLLFEYCRFNLYDLMVEYRERGKKKVSRAVKVERKVTDTFMRPHTPVALGTLETKDVSEPPSARKETAETPVRSQSASRTAYQTDRTLPSGFKLSQVKSIMRQILSAVAFMHARRILHRDIKLSNILYQPTSGLIKLADFGLARVFSDPAVCYSPIVAARWYRAPELLLCGSVCDPASKQYSSTRNIAGVSVRWRRSRREALSTHTHSVTEAASSQDGNGKKAPGGAKPADNKGQSSKQNSTGTGKDDHRRDGTMGQNVTDRKDSREEQKHDPSLPDRSLSLPPARFLYDAGIDMWALGCLFADVVLGVPLFPGNNELDQMQRISDVLGCPTPEQWSLLNEVSRLCFEFHSPTSIPKGMEHGELPHYFGECGCVSGDAVCPYASKARLKSPGVSLIGADGYDLLRGLLEFSADRRLSADQALAHPFFQNLPKPMKIQPNCL